MKITLFFSIFLSTMLCLHAQYKIYGNVYNELGEVVSFASVTLYETSTQKTVTFKNTDVKGNYSLTVSTPGEYTVKVRNIKYDEYETQITLTQDQKEYPLDINLFSKEGQLKTIVAKGRDALAKISGDTITFKIDRFTDKTERNLGDIIKKLPGMEVDENGDIKANGEKVDKLLVEGQEFFSNSQKMATENINAKAVKDIQLLTDYKEDGKLDDLNAEKKTAVNVQLNEEYKGKITGDILLGSGYESKYDFHTNLFKFNKKGNFSFIGDIQNTGESVFSFQDYMGFLGGFSEMSSTGRGQRFGMSFGGNNIWSLINARNNVEKRNNQVGALNINQSLNKKWKVKLTSILSGTQQNAYSEQFRNYYTGTTENIFNTQSSKNFFTSNDFQLKFQPNDSILLTYSANFNYATNLDRNSINNILDGEAQQFDDNNDSDPWGISQRISYEFKPSQKTLVEVGGSYDYNFNPNQNKVLSGNPYLGLPPNSNNRYDTQYNFHRIGSNALLFSTLKYSHKKLIYGIEMGAKWMNYNLQSNWYDLATDSELEPQNFSYNYHLHRNELYTELSLAKNKDFWQYELGAILKYYLLKDGIQRDFHRFAAYPYVDISANFSTANELSFGYEYSEDFPEIENYLPQDDFIINSYRNVQFGNLDINNTTYFPEHRFNLNYRYFDQFSGFNIYSSIRQNYSDGSITSNTIFNSEYNEVYKLIAPKSQSSSAYLYAGKKFKLGIPFNMRGGGNLSFSKGNQYLQNAFFAYSANNYSLNFRLMTDMKPKFNVELGIQYSENRSTIDNPIAPNQFFVSNSPYIELRGAYEKTGINWETKFSRTRSQNIYLNIWDLEFTYQRPNSQWEYGIIGRNLLNFNNQEQVDVSSNTQYYYENRYRILPGYFMLTAKLKL